MGCLEPRPHHEEPNVDASPKVVQKKLLETVQNLTSEEGIREESPPTGDDPLNSTTPTDQQGESLSAPPSSSVKRSQSNNSLKSAANDATNRRTSFGSFFKRYYYNICSELCASFFTAMSAGFLPSTPFLYLLSLPSSYLSHTHIHTQTHNFKLHTEHKVLIYSSVLYMNYM